MDWPRGQIEGFELLREQFESFGLLPVRTWILFSHEIDDFNKRFSGLLRFYPTSAACLIQTADVG